jgi:hypothetical protein
MTLSTERTRRRLARPEPDEVLLDEGRTGIVVLRVLGAVAVLATGAVHLEQYFAGRYDRVAVIGPLFVLNFAGACVIAAVLAAPVGRLHVPAALAGVGLAATSIVFLLISEQRTLFGFREQGYSPPIVVALAAEAAAVLLLGAYLLTRGRDGA